MLIKINFNNFIYIRKGITEYVSKGFHIQAVLSNYMPNFVTSGMVNFFRPVQIIFFSLTSSLSIVATV